MAFPHDVVEHLLVACHRRCCICHELAGNKMEIHHIVPVANGGDDTEENGIPLCLNCHAEVGGYNPQHPKGRRFTPSELRRHKEQWFAICTKPPWDSMGSVRPSISCEIVNLDDRIFIPLKCEDRTPAQKLVGAIMQKDKSIKEEFAKRVFERLQPDKDEDTRWKSANLVEEILLWDPKLIPLDVIKGMSKDPFFSVRSSAAVCYYYLAALDPISVPLDVLSQLASHDEDWYVRTPATSALLRLARSRPVVIDILARGLERKEPGAQEYAASAIKRLVLKDWDLIPEDLVSRMAQSPNSFIRKVGEDGIRKLKESSKEPEKDYGLF